MSFFIHHTSVADEGCRIGNNVKVWHFSHIMPGAEIGDNCSIGQNVFVGQNVKIGSGVKIQNNVSLYEGVVCENDVFIGPSVVFTNVINPRSTVSRKEEFKSTIVKKGASIGANATIICGVEIGEYAFVGAGAVVTKSIIPYALVMGNPARQTGWMSEMGIPLVFENNEAVCSISNQIYILQKGLVHKKKLG